MPTLESPLFRHLAEHSLVGIYIIQDGRLSYVNSTLAKIFGYTPEELTGADPALVIHPDDQAMVSENIRRRIVGEIETVHYEFRGRCKDGKIKNIEVLGGRFDLGGQPAIIGNLMDITDRKRVEAILRQDRVEQPTETSFGLGPREFRLGLPLAARAAAAADVVEPAEAEELVPLEEADAEENSGKVKAVVPESEDDIEIDETLDDDEDDDSTFIADEEEGDEDVTDIIGDVGGDEET